MQIFIEGNSLHFKIVLNRFSARNLIEHINEKSILPFMLPVGWLPNDNC